MLKELENRLHRSDEKDSKLEQRNAQLAKAQEITLAINAGRTFNEINKSLVDLAGDLPGINMVLVIEQDIPNGKVAVRLHSKIRNTEVATALIALGIDPTNIGIGVQSNKTIKFSDATPQKYFDITSSLRIIVRERLCEILEGIWPKEICDTIQTLAGIKRNVLIPVTVEGRYFQSILFILDSDISQDILETIGTHCSGAFENIRRIQNLEKQNRELLATNEITKQTSRSLDLNQILENAIRKSVYIFGADSGQIYLLDEQKAGLKLVSQTGIPESKINSFQYLPIDQTIKGKFFSSDKNSLMGEMEDFIKDIPSLNSILEEGVRHHFIYLKLRTGENTFGVISLARTNGNPFNAEDKSLFQVIADQIALTIENTRLQKDLIKRMYDAEQAKKELEIAKIKIEEALTELTKSEKKFRLMSENTVDYITMLNFKGEYTYLSPSHKNLGYDITKLLGKSGFDFIHPDDREGLLPVLAQYASMPPEQLLRLKNESYTQTIGLRMTDKEGNWHYLESKANLVDAFDGNGLNILIVSRDVTEHVEAETIIKESEEKYKTIFESAHDIFLLMDNSGTVMDINSRVKDVGGWDREELIGKNIRSLSRIITQESLPVVIGNLEKRISGEYVPPYQVEFIKKNGERATFEISARALMKEGKIVGDLAILRDMTASRKADLELQSQKALIDRILSSEPNAVLVIDKDRRIILANKAFYRMRPQHDGDVVGLPLEQLKELETLFPRILEIQSGKSQSCQVECKCNLGGLDRTFIANVINMEKEEALLILNDITEIREKQAKLLLNERLISIGQMASGITHELNNPLTSVIGLSQLLIQQDVPTEIKTDLEAIHSEARRATDIVRSLLTFARKRGLGRQPTQINRLLEDVLKLRAYEHKVNNIRVETRLDPDLPQVMADSFQMQQVFLNLVLNAEDAIIEANKQGELKIRTATLNGNINITISDDGTGISTENMKNLFTPFFTTKDIGKGTGLGLSICYGTVASHGGRIYADSQPGQGTTFTVELPLNAPQSG